MPLSSVDIYDRATLGHPLIVLLMIAVLALAAGVASRQLELDASSDSLVLENDHDLRYYRGIRARYGSDDFLFVAYSPRADLFSDEVLADLRQLRDELAALERVSSVTSILDVPLIDSPRVSLSEMRQRIRTLETPDTDRDLARQEFLTSPLYRNLIVSADGKTTALQVFFHHDERYEELLRQREGLREEQLAAPLTEEEQARLEEITRAFQAYSTELRDREQADIAAVRRILAEHEDTAEIHLGGVPMIVSDMIDFIRSDIRTFGIGVACFLVVLLSVSFKRPRWVLVPMAVCLVTGLVMSGYLGLMGWRITVVSSNFISLLLIITLSLTVHLIVRYLEIHDEHPEIGQRELLRGTVRSKFLPSLYTALTTMVAFASLIVSGIRPVIDFGWMMVIGVGVAFLLSFVMFPPALALLPPGSPVVRRHDFTARITGLLARLIESRSAATLWVYALAFVLSIAGILRITVENSFINYFKESTDIHQGMLLIDRALGGTIPLDVILDADRQFLEAQSTQADEPVFQDDFPPFEPESAAGISGDSYWFNIFQLERLARIHEYLEERPETGKVLSMATTMALLRQLNNDEPLDNLTLSVMYRRLPDDVKSTLVDPYLAPDGNQARFAIRVVDSDPDLRRDDLLSQLRKELSERFDLAREQIHLSGMLVLYNNVLQSLFKSQVLTISAVFAAIFLMFLLLFRSLRLAAIGVVPTMAAAALILGLMGWLGIPLDIMTITIAAITIGIGVDDTIHYLHRLREEFQVDGDYWGAVRRSHQSVGRAIYYTSITVTLGFSILVLSNFIPTIYFGILTGIAMVVALIANLTLLPLLVVKFRPLGAGTPG